MLSAQNAKANTDKIRKIQISKARDMVINEWQTYLEPRIEDAVKQGNYYTTYHWSQSVFNKCDVIIQDFIDQLKFLADQLAYTLHVTTIGAGSYILDLKIVIEWREVYE